MPSVPAGFILEAGRLTPEDRAAGIVLSLTVIPLDAAALTLPATTIPFGSAGFEVPPLRVPVNPAPQRARAASPGETAHGAEPAANVPAVATPAPFPDFESLAIRHSILPGLFRDAFANTCATAKNLWDRGYRAESLAELRRNERDHFAAPLFRSVRKTAEQSIGLSGTYDEQSRYVHILFSLVCFFLTISAAFVCLMLPLPSWGKRTGLILVIFCTAAGIWHLYRFAAGGEPFLRQSRSGVLKETAARRVPDPEGAVSVHFREGRPIRLSPAAEKTGSWVWVSSYGGDEAAGWVAVKDIVLY
jgi:hypothetical protein